jgi:PAS domain S-box-containing protein
LESNELKVLAIDDNADNLTSLRAVIQDLLPSCTVLTARDGACGIEAARAADPDVILLDLIMPGLDGFAVCRQLKADEHLRSIPVVFLTAIRTDRESRVRALQAGGEGFLTKPVDELELVAAIQAMAKIRAANRIQGLERAQLAAMVDERTRKIEENRCATLNLLEDLRVEIEVRKQTENELRANQASLRETRDYLEKLFAHANSPIIVWDAEFRITRFNRASERLTGILAEEALGQRPDILFPPESRDASMDIIRLTAGECWDEMEIPILDRRTGEAHIVHWSSASIFRPDGETLEATIVQGTDISQRRRAEQLLQAKESRQREFVSLLSDLVNDSQFFSGDLTHNIRRIITRSAEVMKTARTSVWVYSEDLSRMRCYGLYERDSGAFREGEVLQCEDFPEYLAAHQLGRVIAAMNVRTDPRALQIPASYYDAHGIQSLMDAPIWIHGRLTALLSFEHVGDVHSWLAEEEQLAQTLATFVSFCFEAAERKRTEEALQRTLAERETLLKEVHHRVKNNLQIINSLMSLQARKEPTPAVVEAFRTMQNRVRSMALLHETLYRSDDLARIDFKRYVERMCMHLAQSCGLDRMQVQLETRIGSIKLPLDRAVSCGLLINELVTNALKHAFPDGRSGRTTVALESAADQQLVLTVADDGTGLADVQDTDGRKSLGMELIRRLTEQLDGTLSVDRGPPGTAFRVVFPAS